MMRFFRRKESTTDGLSKKNEDPVSISESLLNYFSFSNKLHKTIIDHERNTRQQIIKENSGLTYKEIDELLNKRLIHKRALQKYDVQIEDEFSLDKTIWFPRLRTYENDGDNESVSSDDSHDGFAGPFAWETKSQQLSLFPPTPQIERKINEANAKALAKKKKKHMTNTGDERIDQRHNYSVESLREKLKENYIEAKKQREKYLNLKSEGSKENDTEKSVNGLRRKAGEQTVRKNYKQSTKVVGPKPAIKSQTSQNNTRVGNDGASYIIDAYVNNLSNQDGANTFTQKDKGKNEANSSRDKPEIFINDSKISENNTRKISSTKINKNIETKVVEINGKSSNNKGDNTRQIQDKTSRIEENVRPKTKENIRSKTEYSPHMEISTSPSENNFQRSDSKTRRSSRSKNNKNQTNTSSQDSKRKTSQERKRPQDDTKNIENKRNEYNNGGSRHDSAQSSNSKTSIKQEDTVNNEKNDDSGLTNVMDMLSNW